MDINDKQLEIIDSPFGSDRVQYEGSVAKKDATLAITYFKKEDEGVFKCVVNGLDHFIKEVTLKVIVLSNVTQFKADNDDIVQGDNVTLSCTVTSGEPSPRIKIQKGSVELNKSVAMETGFTTLKYYFGAISEKDKGRYFCQVTTQGYISTKVYELKVKYPPKFDKSTKEQFECKDTMVTLKCKADGDPKPKVRLVGPGNKTIDKNPFKLKTFGTYRCEANNSVGSDSHVITVEAKTDKPEKPLIDGKCLFKGLAWTTSSKDDNVKFTLQVKEQGSEGSWNDVITTLDNSYSPSANESFSDQKTYEFKIIATNCVGSTESTDDCVIKGESPSSGKRSSNNAGAIAGSVIAALIVILTVVIIAVVIIKRRRRESAEGRTDGESRPMTDTSNNTSKPKPARSPKDGELLSDNASNDGVGAPSSNSEKPGYAEIDHDDTSAPTYSNNIPSWV